MKLFSNLVFAALFLAVLPMSLKATEVTDTPDTLEDAIVEMETGSAPGDMDAADTDDAVMPDPETELLFLDAREVDVRDFIWEKRIIVVMAETPDDPQFARQLDALRLRADDFVQRDAVVIFDAHPADRSPLRQVLRPRGFTTAIIDKDGEVKARRPAVRSGRELTAVIDRFPTRRQEMLEQRPSGR